MENTYTVKQLFDLLKKRTQLILTCLFAGLAVAGILTFFVITPKYRSQAQLVVTLPQKEGTNVNDVNTNLQMINTYKDFIVSDSVMTEVQKQVTSAYKLNLTSTQIKDMVAVEQNQNSQMFSIKVTSPKAADSAHISNTVAKVFQESAKDVLNVDRISIISNAVINPKPVSPNHKLNLLIGIVLGTMVGVGIVFVLELLNRTVKDPNFVTEELGFTLLGTVPELSDKEIASNIKKAINLNRMGNPSTKNPQHEGKAAPQRRRTRV